MFLTVFTPTYNRSHTIVRTYNSLLRQQIKDFEWLIVDDGSSDNTEDMIKNWSEEAPFPIRYIKQKNGGKYRAYNNGLRNAKGDLFFCVDSDDWIPDNLIEKILQLAKGIFSDEQLGGIIALKEYPSHQIIGQPFMGNITRSSLYNLELLGQKGERSLVFKTHVARLFPFPEDSEEMFMTESVVYDRFEGKYDFLVSNEVLTICEYQETGLSSNPRALMLKNPLGYKLYFAQRIDLVRSTKERLFLVLKYHAFRSLANKDIYNYVGKYPNLVRMLKPLGCLMKFFYRHSI